MVMDTATATVNLLRLGPVAGTIRDRHIPLEESTLPTIGRRFEAVVRNDGRTTAKSVEATAEPVAWRDGERWQKVRPNHGPRLLVWSGTDQTRTHIPPDGRWRRLSVFVIAPVHHPEASPLLALAVPPIVSDPRSAAGIGPNRTRVRLEVTSEGGATASCEMFVEWDPSEEGLTAEGDCVGSLR